MASTSTKVGHGLAKVLGIKLDYRDPTNEKLTRGESTFSIESADSYIEDEPHASEWLRSIVPTPKGIGRYFYNLFPFIHWIGRYNLQWFTGDLIAGVTIGAVVVPQSMSYAGLAELPPEYGLYSSFMGVLIYWFFATSKDITIGVSTSNIQCTESSTITNSYNSQSLSCQLLSVTLSITSGITAILT